MMGSKQVVAVISDTHGLFDPKIPLLLKGVDHILHAGDIGDLQVYQKLQELAPVTAIRGNVDEGVLPPEFPSQRTFILCGIHIFMVHILGHPHRLPVAMQNHIAKTQPEVVIFGHSHQPFSEKIGPILFFNPGSAGPKRFSLPRSLGLLEIEDKHFQAKIIDL